MARRGAADHLIGEHLVISERTAQNHVQHILHSAPLRLGETAKALRMNREEEPP